MASGIKVRLNSAGARAVLTSISVQADITARAEAICDRANGMVSADKMRNVAFMEDFAGDGGRARAVVFAASTHGKNAQNKGNVLLNSIDAGR